MPRYVLASVVVLLAVTACDDARPPTVPGPVPGAPSNPRLFGVLGAPSNRPTSLSDSTVGRYRLQLEIGPGEGCALVPESARNRTYTADIHPETAGTYLVKLYDSRFLNNEFLASRDGDSLKFSLTPPPESEFNDNIVYEQLPDGRFIEINGEAAGTRGNGAITAEGDVTLSYWQGSPGASEYSVCTSSDFRLTFVPQ